jgi:hypothetical protein
MRFAATGAVVAALLSLSLRSDEVQDGPPRLERTPGGFGPAEDGRERSEPLLEKQGWVYLHDGRPETGDGALALWREPEILSGVSSGKDDGPAAAEALAAAVRISSGPAGTQLTIEPPPGLTIDVQSRQNFWDFDLHVELSGSSSFRGALVLRGRHEIALAPTPSGKPREELEAGDMGGVCGNPPAENASRGPGAWQSLDASLRGHRLSVRLNGVPVQTSAEIPATGDPRTPGPLGFRVSEGTLEIRSVRIRPRPTPAIWRNPPRAEE